MSSCASAAFAALWPPEIELTPISPENKPPKCRSILASTSSCRLIGTMSASENGEHARRPLTTEPRSPTTAETTAVWRVLHRYLNRTHQHRSHTARCFPKKWPRKMPQPPTRFALGTSRQLSDRAQARFPLHPTPTRQSRHNPSARSAPVLETRLGSRQGA